MPFSRVVCLLRFECIRKFHNYSHWFYLKFPLLHCPFFKPPPLFFLLLSKRTLATTLICVPRIFADDDLIFNIGVITGRIFVGRTFGVRRYECPAAPNVFGRHGEIAGCRIYRRRPWFPNKNQRPFGGDSALHLHCSYHAWDAAYPPASYSTWSFIDKEVWGTPFKQPVPKTLASFYREFINKS